MKTVTSESIQEKKMPWVRHPEVARLLRNEIVTGRLSPGSKLPTWDVLESQYSVSRATLMRAIDRLREDGFVCGEGRRGTFVTERPPHLNRYAIVFEEFDYWRCSEPQNLQTLDIPKGWKIFHDEIHRVAVQTNRNVELYQMSPEKTNQKDLDLLCERLESDLLAGVIFAASTWPATYKPLAKIITERCVPTVVIRSKLISARSQALVVPMPGILLDYTSFLERSLRWAVERGAKRVAVIAAWDEQIVGVRELLRSFGLPVCRHLLLSTALDSTARVEAMTELLFQLPQGEQPDALVIMDDNIVPAVTQVLYDLQISVGDRLKVLALTTWPELQLNPLVSEYLGFPMTHVARASFGMIDFHRQQRTPHADLNIVPCFQNELDEQGSLLPLEAAI